MRRLLVGFFLIIFCSTFYGQGVIGGILEMPLAPASAGSGWTGVSGNTGDPLSFYYNPAKLGVFDEVQSISGFVNARPANWLNDKVTIQMKGFAIKQDLKKYLGIPVKAGFGYSYGKVDYNGFARYPYGSTLESARYENYDKFNSYNLGIGIDFPVKISLGMEIKNYATQFNDVPELNSTVNSYGVYILFPFRELIPSFGNLFGKENKIKPLADISIGYAARNNGEKLKIDVHHGSYNYEYKYNLPESVRLGYTISLGAEMLLDKSSLELIRYSFTGEADDLIMKDDFYSTKISDDTYYWKRSASGGAAKISEKTVDECNEKSSALNIWKNLVKLESDGEVIAHKAHRLDLAETFTFMSGSMDNLRGAGNSIKIKSSGYIFRTDGLFKLLGSELDNETVKWITEHLSFSYSYVRMYEDMTKYYYLEKDVIVKGFGFEFKNLVSF